MTFLIKEKHFNLLYFLSPNVRGARRKPPPRGDPGGSASSAGLGGLLYGSMGPPGVSPTLPPNTSGNLILKIPISNSIVYVLELCIFSMNFHLVCVCLGLPSTAVYLYLWGKDLEIVTRLSVLNQSFLINFIMTFLTKEKDFNLLYFLSPGVRGAR